MEPITLLIKEGAELAAKKSAEFASSKTFSRLGTELGRLAAQGKLDKPINDIITKAAETLKPNEASAGFEMKVPNEIKKNEISFTSEYLNTFPWENHFPGFKGEAALEKSLINSDVEKQALRTERHPAKLPTDVAQRLVNEAPNFDWGNPSERLNYLNEAFRIMAEEACIPADKISSAIIDAGPLAETTNACTNLFVDLNESGNFYIKDKINITFNADNLANPNYKMEDALSTLYHEVIHVMQEQSLCESGNTFTYAEMQNEWKEDVKKRIMQLRSESNQSESFIDYLTSAMETYAHMQSGYFSKIYEGVAYENMYSGITGIAAEAKPIRTKLITVPEF